MERATLALIALFFVLFLGQIYLRESFVDISNSTVTMSLSDLLYTIGSRSGTGTGTGSRSGTGYGYPSPRGCGHTNQNGDSEDEDLEKYLLMKHEMLKGVKSGLRKSVPPFLKEESPACTQGSAYMETVPLVASNCS